MPKKMKKVLKKKVGKTIAKKVVTPLNVNLTLGETYTGKNYTKPFSVQQETRNIFIIKDMGNRVIITVNAETQELGNAIAQDECGKLNALPY